MGYGDFIPFTWLGRSIAFICALFGVIAFGLPIPIIVRSFSKYYAVIRNKHSRVLTKYRLAEVRGLHEKPPRGRRRKSVLSNMGVNEIE